MNFGVLGTGMVGRTVASKLVELGMPPVLSVCNDDSLGARGTEMYLPLWLRLFAAKGSGHLNVKVISKA